MCVRVCMCCDVLDVFFVFVFFCVVCLVWQGGEEVDSMSGADANLLEENVAKLAEA